MDAQRVSLVRVDSEWHVFADSQAAWAFYVEWREIKDCECLIEAPVQALEVSFLPGEVTA